MAKEKNENSPTTASVTANPTAKWSRFWGFSSQELHQISWNTLNFTTVAAATSAGIVAVQSPTKTLLVNLTKNGSFMPSFSGGALAFFRALYAGTSASLSSSAARTIYVTGAKSNKPIELASEEELVKETGKKEFSKAKLGYIMSAAFGDLLVTQIPESLSTLKKVPGLIPPTFKWYTLNNAYQLMTGGFTARYVSGMVNFSSLCLLEGHIANCLPFENGKTKHFLAGALSGSTAAFFSYPFSVFKDYTIVQATITNGQLANKSTLSIIKDMTHAFQSNPKQVMGSFFLNAVKQMPIRMGLTGMIFSIVSGVSETLGPEPLKSVVPERFQPSVAKKGFFGGSTQRDKIAEATPTKEAEIPSGSNRP